MSVFAGYSRYYDLLYRDKDYAGEAKYVAELIRHHASQARTVMEIGCGTGAHAVELAQLGFDVAGVDMSEGMLEAADARRASLAPDIAAKMEFARGDARTVRLGRKFDAVISLFHVMSYQTTNADLAAVFTTAREHLEPGGVFVFDCWYGPAVLRQWPAVTEKNLSDDATEIARRAEPVIHAAENVVDVNYTVVVTDKLTRASETLRETHRMRYLFTPEIEMALSTARMTLVDSRGWMTDSPPGFETWGAVFVGRG
ncbi:MAG TPA: class I SAM-dependent methyltransferase [Gemmatimonadaceae bacterium]